MFRLTSSARKFVLATHVTSSVAWMGGVACFLVLAIAGFTSSQTQTVQAAYVAMSLICWFVIIPLSLAGKRSADDHAPYALPTWILWLRRITIAVAVAFLAAHLAGKGIGGHGLH